MIRTALGLAIALCFGPLRAGAADVWAVDSAYFAEGEQGIWLDPSDFERYMEKGPELVTNGTFDTDVSGWAAMLGDTAPQWESGRLKVTATVGFGRTEQVVPVVIGKTYELTMTSAHGTGNAFAYAGPAQNSSQYYNSTGSAGTRVTVFTATTPNLHVSLRTSASGDGGTAYLDNVSVRELTAISTATMFQDSAGTTPVTAMEQPVGLALDKRLGATPGPELAVNGDFAAGATGWTLGSTWTISGGAASVNNPAAFSALTNSAPVAIGKWYEFTFTVASISAGSVAVRLGGGGYGVAATAAGTYTCRVMCAGTATAYLQAAAGTIATVDNISVRELPGNHASQATTAAKPVLSARKNLFINTEAFDLWTKTDSTVEANATLAPDGTMSADKVVAIAAGSPVRVYSNPGASVIGRTVTSSVHFKVGVGLPYVQFSADAAGTVAIFNMTTGALETLTGPSTATNAVPLGDGWFRASVTYTPTAVDVSDNQFWTFTNRHNTQTSLPVLAGGEYAYLWGAQFEVGSTATRYQRVTTATDYDSVGFPHYLKFDGVDDSLVTGSIDFTGTDKMTVIAGVRKLSDAAASVIAELSATSQSNTGSFVLVAADSGNLSYVAYERGTASFSTAVRARTAAAAFPAPNTSVLTMTGSISGDLVALRVNTVDQTNATGDQGTGNFGNYPLYIGRRAGTTLPFNGYLYQLTVRGAATADLTDGETFTAEKTGITL